MGFLWGGDDLAIDKEMISQVKNSVNIVDVIGEVVKLSDQGGIISGFAHFIRKRHPLLMLLKTDNFFTALAVENQGMFLNLLRNTAKSPS